MLSQLGLVRSTSDRKSRCHIARLSINSGTSLSVGSTRFRGASTAGAGAFFNNNGGNTLFADGSAAGLATFNSNSGGYTRFADNSTASNATFTTNGNPELSAALNERLK